MRKQGFGMWLSLLAIIATVVAFVIYGQAIVTGDGLYIASASEPFYNSAQEAYSEMKSTVDLCAIVGIALLAAAVILGQFQNKFFSVIVSVIRIATPVVLMVALVGFLNGSLTGLGWTFFSNEELEIFEAAIEVGNQVIISLGAFAAATVISMFSAFFAISKKVAKKVED